MITLHSISKEVGRGHEKRLVLDDISWVIPARSHHVILGQKGAGKTTFLQVLVGMAFPTKGWIERRGVISAIGALARFGAPPTTTRQLCHRLATLYHADFKEIDGFVEKFAELEGLMDRPMTTLTSRVRQKVSLALFYGLPCDLYLFDGAFETNIAELKDWCRAAFLRRQQEASTLLVTSVPNIAREFGGRGGLFYRGKLTIFSTVEEAIAEYEALPPVDEALLSEEDAEREYREEVDEF